MFKHTLTREDITLLRTATNLYIRTEWNHDYQSTTTIRAVKRVRNKGPWDEGEKTRLIQIDDCVIRAYRGFTGAHEGDLFRPYHADMTIYPAEAPWQTVCHLLRPGDALRVRWCHNDGSEEQETSGFVSSSVSLIVVRQSGPTKPLKVFEFLLDRHATRSWFPVTGEWIPVPQAVAA